MPRLHPAGLFLSGFGQFVSVEDVSLLDHGARFLDPFKAAIKKGFSYGYIILAFILGLPANEIVIPIIVISYTASRSYD